MLEQNISAAKRTLRNCEQADSPDAVREYFSFLLYTLRGEERLDEKNILPDAEKLRFQSVSRAFHLIDGTDYTVYVPIGDGANLIRRLRREGPSRSLLRALGQFSVGVYRQYFERLRDAGALELISDNAGILADLNLYSRETGLPLEVSEQK
jgi:CRISPR-associated endonuclease/helicase Cas3